MNRFVLVAGMVAVGLQAAFGADAPEAYRKLWNDAVNAGIDERIERHRKADGNGRIAFRGFRGQYRLSWTDADGRTETREVGVR